MQQQSNGPGPPRSPDLSNSAPQQPGPGAILSRLALASSSPSSAPRPKARGKWSARSLLVTDGEDEEGQIKRKRLDDAEPAGEDDDAQATRTRGAKRPTLLRRMNGSHLDEPTPIPHRREPTPPLPSLLSHLSLSRSFPSLPSASTSASGAEARFSFAALPSRPTNPPRLHLHLRLHLQPPPPPTEGQEGKRPSSSPNPHLRERTKKRKLAHRFFRCEALLHPPTPASSSTSVPSDSEPNRPSPSSSSSSASPKVETTYQPKQSRRQPTWWPSVSLSLGEGRPSRLAPEEGVWEGDGRGWVVTFDAPFSFTAFTARSTASAGEAAGGADSPLARGSNTASARPPPPPPSSPSASTAAPSPTPARRSRSISSPPALQGAATAAASGGGGPWAPPPLKQHLLAVLRMRLNEGGGSSRGGEAGLRFKKWVVWNSWMRRTSAAPGEPTASDSPADSPSSSALSAADYASSSDDKEVDEQDGGDLHLDGEVELVVVPSNSSEYGDEAEGGEGEDDDDDDDDDEDDAFLDSLLMLDDGDEEGFAMMEEDEDGGEFGPHLHGNEVALAPILPHSTSSSSTDQQPQQPIGLRSPRPLPSPLPPPLPVLALPNPALSTARAGSTVSAATAARIKPGLLPLAEAIAVIHLPLPLPLARPMALHPLASDGGAVAGTSGRPILRRSASLPNSLGFGTQAGAGDSQDLVVEREKSREQSQSGEKSGGIAVEV